MIHFPKANSLPTILDLHSPNLILIPKYFCSITVDKWAQLLLDPNHAASKYTDGTAFHWYAGGMDRLLDGAQGIPNLHRLVSELDVMKVDNGHIMLGSEACHCPSTGYAGGDITIAWAGRQGMLTRCWRTWRRAVMAILSGT